MPCNLRGGEAATGWRRRQHRRETATPAHTTGGDEAATGRRRRQHRRETATPATRRRRGGDNDNIVTRPLN
eukprot:8048325-Pyramimonas_sp.AAC.1